MSANGIAHLATKELKQKGKLDIAQAKRQGFTVAANGTISGSADSSKPYYRLNNIYDITLLPTQYSDDSLLDNINPNGLLLGRPWEILALEANLLVDLSAANNASYPESGSSWNDVSGNSNNFALYNSPTYSGTSPQYITFDKASLQYGDAPCLGNLNQWSVEAWFRTSSNLAAEGATGLRSIVTTVYDDNVGNVYGNINFTLTNYDGVGSCSNSIRTGFYNGAWHVTGALSVTAGVWYHVIGTYDGVNLKQYNNGTLASTVAVGSASIANGGPVRIGRRWDGNLQSKYCFPGDIGLIRIYNGPLSSDQVASNFSQERDRFGI